MGLLDLFVKPSDTRKEPQKHRRRGRPTKEVAAERRRQRVLDAQSELKLLELEMELDAKRRKLATGEEKKPMDLPTLLEAIKVLRELRRIDARLGGGEGESDESAMAFARDVLNSPVALKVVEGLMPAMMQKRTAAGAQVVRPAPMASVQGPGLAPAPPGPAGASSPHGADVAAGGEISAAPAGPGGPATVAPAPHSTAEPKTSARAPMAFMSAYAKGALEKRDAAEAAEWLVSLGHPEIDQLVEMLCHAADEQVVPMLRAVGERTPDFRGLVQWLEEERGEQWLVDVVHHLRRLTAEGKGSK